jgi:hypothetical protein
MIHIYLSYKSKTPGRYEIYRDGKPTGEMTDTSTLLKILSQEQYKEFMAGEQIFYVDGNLWRSRHYKRKKRKKSDFLK